MCNAETVAAACAGEGREACCECLGQRRRILGGVGAEVLSVHFNSCDDLERAGWMLPSVAMPGKVARAPMTYRNSCRAHRRGHARSALRSP